MDITPELLLNGALAFLIIKEVLQFVIIFLKKKSTSNDIKAVITAINNSTQSTLTSIDNLNRINLERNNSILLRLEAIETNIDRILEQSNHMYDWHNARDDDGVFIWYVRKSLAKSLDGVATSLLHQNDALKQISIDNKELYKEYSDLYNMTRDNQKTLIENQNLIKENKILRENLVRDLEKLPDHMKDCRDTLMNIVKNELRDK